MKTRVWTTPEADTQADIIDDWWRLHRDSAPDLFMQELRDAVALLENHPDIGRPFPHRRLQGVRRVLLASTNYHVYYAHDALAHEIAILAVWSAMRRRAPRLRLVKRQDNV